MLETVALICPIFAITALGYAASQRRLVDAKAAEALNGFAFWIALPALLFGSMAKAGTGGLLGVAAIYLGCCVAVYACAMVLSATLFRRGWAEAAMFSLNATYGNVIYFGIPLVTSVLAGASLPVILAIIAVHTGVLLPLTAALIEFGVQPNASVGTVAKRTLMRLAMNPIVVAIVLGLLWRLTGLDLPQPLQNLLIILGGAAAPLALFCLGTSLPSAAIGSLTRAEVIAGALIKLIVLPCLVAFVCTQLQVSDLVWRVSVLTAAVPTGANAILLAHNQAVLTEISAGIVLLSTAVSILTISAVIYLLH